MEQQTEKPKELQDWVNSLSPEQLEIMIAILQSQMFTLDRLTREATSTRGFEP